MGAPRVMIDRLPTNAGIARSRHVMREPEDEGLKEESCGGRVSHKGEEEILNEVRPSMELGSAGGQIGFQHSAKTY